jgi:RecB family exonuclease|tara:strand:- start:8223 stop:8894 length:672 start_codon:yes stop_codon:yes gene_type:complete
MTKVWPWSFSKIKAFEQCPKQFYHERVLKEFPFKETEATLYGTAFHSMAEDFIGKDIPVPEKFAFARKALTSLKRRQGQKLCEEKLGVTENLEACDFYAADVWFRGIADLVILNGEVAIVVDYKTGKSARYADKGQLELMALSVFAHYPQIKKIRAGLLFVISKDLVKDTYMEYDSEQLWRKWLGKYTQMQVAADNDVWNARPSGLCNRHCLVIECVHNGANA